MMVRLVRPLFSALLLSSVCLLPLSAVRAETAGVQSMARGDYARALRELTQAAKAGNAQAQMDLGRAFLEGKGTQADAGQAFRWITQAAGRGLPEAEYELGVLYDEGNGTTQNPVLAAEWYQKAVGHNYLPAYFPLGELYRLGRGVTRDEGQALKLFRMAADRQDTDSQLALGKMVRDGIGLPANDNDASIWFRKAASLGNPEGSYLLAMMLLKGQSPETLGYAPSAQSAEAIQWLEQSATLNYGPSLYYLGMASLHGIIVGYDPGKAVGYLLRAADQGEALAALKLGQLFQEGKSVRADGMQSYSYYAIAEALGEERARTLRQDVGQRLTTPQQQMAQKRAKEWLEMHGY